MTLKAVVFDSDGTLLNGFDVYHAAQIYAAKKHDGVEPSREAYAAALRKGKTLLEIFQELQPGKDHDAMIAANGEYLVDHLTDTTTFSGLIPMLEQLRDMGLQIALLTGGNHKIHMLLEHHDIAAFFSSVVHFERTAKPKPDPEGFLLAVQECGVRPEQAVMVGDTVTDIRTGQNAGALATIGVTHGISTRNLLQEAGADYIVDSLPELIEVLQTI